MTRRQKKKLKITRDLSIQRKAEFKQRSCERKKKYNSDLEALAWGRESNERRNESKVWNAYFCRFCHKWHLTKNH